jgi:hypothetical protein
MRTVLVHNHCPFTQSAKLIMFCIKNTNISIYIHIHTCVSPVLVGPLFHLLSKGRKYYTEELSAKDGITVTSFSVIQ